MTQKVLNSGTVSFGQIHYTVPGDYQYKIYQKSGSTDRFTYDKTVYTVTVRVQNDAEGGLTAELWAVKEGTTMKNDAVQFQNHYDAPGNNGGGSSHHHRTEETVTYTTVIQQPPAANWGTAYRRCSATASVGCTDPAYFKWKYDNSWKNEKVLLLNKDSFSCH